MYSEVELTGVIWLNPCALLLLRTITKQLFFKLHNIFSISSLEVGFKKLSLYYEYHENCLYTIIILYIISLSLFAIVQKQLFWILDTSLEQFIREPDLSFRVILLSLVFSQVSSVMHVHGF